jgi:hypothetical protein
MKSQKPLYLLVETTFRFAPEQAMRAVGSRQDKISPTRRDRIDGGKLTATLEPEKHNRPIAR